MYSVAPISSSLAKPQAVLRAVKTWASLSLSQSVHRNGGNARMRLNQGVSGEDGQDGVECGPRVTLCPWSSALLMRGVSRQWVRGTGGPETPSQPGLGLLPHGAPWGALEGALLGGGGSPRAPRSQPACAQCSLNRPTPPTSISGRSGRRGKCRHGHTVSPALDPTGTATATSSGSPRPCSPD